MSAKKKSTSGTASSRPAKPSKPGSPKKATSTPGKSPPVTPPAPGPEPILVPQLFDSVISTAKLTQGMTVTIEAVPESSKLAPTYVVTVTGAQKGCAYSMLTLGLQSGTQYKGCDLVILDVIGTNLLLSTGPSPQGIATWVPATPAPKLPPPPDPRWIIDCYTGPNDVPDAGRWITADSAAFSLKVHRVNGRRKRPTRWDLTRIPPFDPDGDPEPELNAPPALPPGGADEP